MIYKFLKWYAALGIKFYYKNIFIQYNSNLPKTHPIIYASNHPSGFYESLVFATISKIAPIYLVRADYVSIKGLIWIFKILKLYPIYRQSEGLKDVSKNNEVFNLLYNELAAKTPVCIYPEGTTKFNFRIRTIKKGISRLAIGAKKNGIRDIKIAPIAFNFVEPVKFRSNLFILSSDLMSLDHIDGEQLNNPTSLRALTIEIEKKMREVVLDLDSKEQHELYQRLQLLFVNDNFAITGKSGYIKNSELPEKVNNLSNKIKKLDEKSFYELNKKTIKYFSELNDNKTNDRAVISNKNTLIDSMLFIFGYPLYILGILVNAIPILFALNIQKNKIKQYEYKTVVTVLIAQFSYIIYLLLLLVLSLFIFSTLGLIVLTFPFLAWYSLKFYDFKNNYLAINNFTKSQNKDYLVKLRAEIGDIIRQWGTHEKRAIFN